eukprot:1155342-Pelagomonas_calceolata.AAC.6
MPLHRANPISILLTKARAAGHSLGASGLRHGPGSVQEGLHRSGQHDSALKGGRLDCGTLHTAHRVPSLNMSMKACSAGLFTVCTVCTLSSKSEQIHDAIAAATAGDEFPKKIRGWTRRMLKSAFKQ